jgi:2-amino-4-hydroxy-6-hydroxymethyldihydropteridine diphosphokinase
MPEKRVFLSLGSNLGAREQNLELALQHLEAAHVHVVSRSKIYETEPQDLKGQPWFLNMAIECQTRLFPMLLLEATQKIEHELGRERRTRTVNKGPRIIDIDILLYAGHVIRTPRLEIPHPRMLQRRFVLEPLVEISPQLRDPASGSRLQRRLQLVLDQRIRVFERQESP